MGGRSTTRVANMGFITQTLGIRCNGPGKPKTWITTSQCLQDRKSPRVPEQLGISNSAALLGAHGRFHLILPRTAQTGTFGRGQIAAAGVGFALGDNAQEEIFQ